ncbi:carboxylate--amine ligase [Streptomyces sp. KR80]|uniref:carboxylate--amine ligase n=1 Tax=Streptomyces sp. KR80 TaxID=3457426 RepID=UPI003FD2070F
MHHHPAAHPAPQPTLETTPTSASRPTFDTAVPVLLIRLDHNPFHHGTLGAVRSLGRVGIEVHTLVESLDSPVNRSRYVHRAHSWSPGGPSVTQLPETLRRIGRRIGRPAVLIPMDDVSAIVVARHAELLADSYLMPAQPTGLPQRVADKAELATLCASAGVPYPTTVIPASGPEAAATARDLGLPVVAKWSRPWLLPRAAGLRSTTLIRTPGEARLLYEHSGRAGSRLLLQRHLPGTHGTDWFFHGCFGEGAVCLHGGTGRKELSWPVGTGLTAVGTWLPNPEVELAARQLAERVGYRGILDLDFRRDSTTGSYHLLDFNPRPGAQFRLFTDRTGLDVVRALHLDLTGRPVAAGRPVPGRVFMAENYALLSGVAAVTTARPRLRPERRRLRTGRPYRFPETAWFAADDPAPFAAMAAGWLGRGGVKGLRRLRPRPAAVPAS